MSDELRLRSCPQCEYSLQGLPEEGICPECGCAYDRCAVIVRCCGSGLLQFNSYVIGAAGAIPLAIIVSLIVYWPAMIGHLAHLIVFLGFLIVMSALTLIDRATSPRVGDWLLWITPRGIGVQVDFDPESLLARARRAIAVFFWPVYVMSEYVPMVSNGISLWYVGVIPAVLMALAFLWLQRVMQPKPNIPAHGARPQLFGWDYVNKLEISGPKLGRFRVAAWRSSWIAKRQILIDVRIPGPDEMIGQLRQQIGQWYKNQNHAN